MKKLVLVVIAVLISGITFSQTEVVSAYNYLKNGQLDKAKTYIDKACVNEKTKGLAKTWFYCGNVYLSIALTKEENTNRWTQTPYKLLMMLTKKPYSLIRKLPTTT